MKWNPVSRRMFLQTTGGWLLAIPFLPSLVYREARALGLPREGFRLRYVTINHQHGGLWTQHMYPDSHLGYMIQPSTLTNQEQYRRLIAQGPTTRLTVAQQGARNVGYDVFYDPIRNFIHPLGLNGGNGFSELIGSEFNSLLDHMTVIRGLDTTMPSGHHVGNAGFGNLGRSDGFGGNTGVAGVDSLTIDQIIAASSSFYNSEPLSRSVSLGNTGRMHTRWNNTRTRLEDVGSNMAFPNSRTISAFDRLVSARQGTLPDGTGTTNPNTTTTVRRASPLAVLNAVMDDLRGIQGKLSRADKLTLDQHLSGLNSFATNPNVLGLSIGKTTTTTTPGGGGTRDATLCGPMDIELMHRPNGNQPTNPTSAAELDRLYYDMSQITLALIKCDATRQVNLAFDAVYSGPYNVGTRSIDMRNVSIHHAVWHDNEDNGREGIGVITRTERQRIRVTAFDAMARGLYKRIIEGLNVEDPLGNDRTYLDNSLVHLTAEHGGGAHSTYSMPTFLAGRAGGRIKSGLYMDFRRRVPLGSLDLATPNYSWENNNSGTPRVDESEMIGVYGAPINRFWISLMRSFGVPGSEFLQDQTILVGRGDAVGTDLGQYFTEGRSVRTYGRIFDVAAGQRRGYYIDNATIGKPLPFLHPDGVGDETD